MYVLFSQTAHFFPSASSPITDHEGSSNTSAEFPDVWLPCCHCAPLTERKENIQKSQTFLQHNHNKSDISWNCCACANEVSSVLVVQRVILMCPQSVDFISHALAVYTQHMPVCLSSRYSKQKCGSSVSWDPISLWWTKIKKLNRSKNEEACLKGEITQNSLNYLSQWCRDQWKGGEGVVLSFTPVLQQQ